MALNSAANFLHSLINPPLNTIPPGTEITAIQFDTNMINIYNDLVALNSGGDVPAYDPLKEYDSTTNKFVSYGGFVWLYIFATPTTGTTPVEGTHWTQVQPSVLAHPKNQDSHLDLGGANEVSAAELSILEITYSDLEAKKADSELVKNKTYSITDYGISIKAISTSELSTCGCRVMRIVKNTYYQPSGIIKGVWNGGLSVSTNDVAVWGGKVWINQTGSIGSKLDDDNLDATNWAVESETNNTYYFDKSFFVMYDFDSNVVSEQHDDRGNVFIQVSTGVIERSDWGNNLIAMNRPKGGIYNNSNALFINGNTNFGSIFENSNATYILNNSNSGNISGNSNGSSISSNSNNGAIQNCSNTGSIGENRNNGFIMNIGSSNSGINNNINNGDISTTTTGNISDTIVNK